MNLISDRHGREQPSVMVYRREADDTRSLVDFMEHDSLSQPERQGTVYVIENAMESGIQRKDLAEFYLSRINRKLESQQSYLILTSSPIDNVPGVKSLETKLPTKAALKLFEKFLQYYEQGKADKLIYDSVIKLARQNCTELLKILKTYTAIKDFCDAITDLPFDCTQEVFLKTARAILQVNQKQVRNRFRDQELNARLYGLLAVLFYTLPKTLLDEIYIEAVQILQNQGVANLHDARQFGLLDLLEDIQAELGADGRIRFKRRYTEEHIRRQQITNHHHLLWSLMEMLYGLAENYAGFRKPLGIAIGKLGVYHEAKLFNLLEKLAGHKNGSIASVPAYALDEICRQHTEKYNMVITLIKRWVQSGNPDLMWAAGVAIGRIYGGVASRSITEDDQHALMRNRLNEILLDLASTFDRSKEELRKIADQLMSQNSDLSNFTDHLIAFALMLELWFEVLTSSLAQAIRSIARTCANDAVKLVIRWLKADRDSRQREVGELMTQRLLADNDGRRIILIEKTHRPLLELIGPVLDLAAKTKRVETLNQLVGMLKIWLRNNQGDWEKRIHAALLRVVNRATLDGRRILRSALSEHFLTSEHPETQRMGQALIARSYVMDGAPLDVPGHRYGVIALDASHWGRLLNVADMGWEFYQRFDSRVDTYTLSMGQAKPTARPGQVAVATDQMQPSHYRPPLLAAALEGLSDLDQSQMHFVLVLAMREILDGEDLDEGSLQDKLLIISPNESVKWRDELAFVHLKRETEPSQNIQVVENKLNEHLGQRLAALEANEWWLTLDSYIEYDSADLDGICAQLNTWAANLDEVEESERQGGVMRILACTILWLTKVDFGRSLVLVQDWLAAPADDTRYLMGLACSKLLFNVYGQQSPPSAIEKLNPILNLVQPMARTNDWGAILAVLQAMRRWLVDQQWASILMGGHILPILVDSTPSINHDDLEKILNAWRDEDAPEAVHQAAERMLMRLALGKGQQFPDLPEGQKYGLILLDASREHEQSLAKVPAEVIEKLENREATKEIFSAITCRMGQRMPVAVNNQTLKEDQLLPSGSSFLPRLAAPLLEQVTPEQVGFILLLTNRFIIDLDDWIEVWRDVPIILYTTSEQVPDWPPSVKIILEKSTQQNPAQTIVDTLLDMMKG